MRSDFGAFILTHGRPKQVGRTIGALRRAGYTGNWWLVLDTDDATRGEYEALWGTKRVLLFDKGDADFDLGDNGGSQAVVVYARNALDPLAQALGLTWYMHLDDDYSFFQYRRLEGMHLTSPAVRQLDEILEAFIDFQEASGALTVAMAQGGDLIGGRHGTFFWRGLARKAMNTFVVRTGRPIPFVGRINEDVNTYVTLATRGEILFTVTTIQVTQAVHQQQDGGMTSTYLETGTYAKSFYTVMMAPSCVHVSAMGEKHTRIHHRINWECAAPKILAEKWRHDEQRR